ncbi:MAG: hypothetical protein K2I07_00155 [Lachnospiraceae bacterium]|nr:hypothetical protein [Lachnospiraceae bacterium]
MMIEIQKDRFEQYLEWLMIEANTSCDYKYNLRLAGAVDALERLGLIKNQLANDIRSILSVK